MEIASRIVRNSVAGHAPSSGVRALLWPRSVALVGASADPSKVSGKPLHNLRLHGFSGEVYAVNPKYTDLDGIACFPSVDDLPMGVDCALVLLPAEKVLPALRGLSLRAVKSAVVVSGGFAEGGGRGRGLQEEMVRLARESGMRVLGPNTLGAVNFHGRAVLSFSTSFEEGGLRAGPVGFVSQSGALMGALANRAADRELGLSYAISTGNESDLEVSDFLDYFAQDEATRVAVAIVEGVQDGPRFLDALTSLRQAEKPAILLKIGRSEEGGRCALAHTGALAGSARVFDAACRKAGAVQVGELEELLETAELFAKGRYPRKRTLGVVTTSGGAAALLADAAGRQGFTLPPPSPQTARALAPLLPPFARQSLNPIDLTAQHLAQPEVFRQCVKSFLADEAFGALVVLMVPGTGTPGRERAEMLAELDGGASKPLVACWIGGELSEPGRGACRRAGVPVTGSPRCVAAALSCLAEYAEGRRETLSVAEAPPEGLGQALSALPKTSAPTLTEYESERWLASCGIPVLRGEMVGNAEEALALAERLGFPVALKAMCPDISHKHKMGLVRLSIQGAAGLREAFLELRRAVEKVSTARLAGILIEPMAPSGVDLLIGAHQDPTFGPVVVFGFGGIHAEILDVVSLRLAPVSHVEADEMLREVRGFPALVEEEMKGPVNLAPIRDVLVRLSHLAAQGSERIESLDLNPIRILSREGECRVLDASIVLRDPDAEEK
ncbi:MAG: acetate--CoA ligase family protein [Nitrospinota bacterium]